MKLSLSQFAALLKMKILFSMKRLYDIKIPSFEKLDQPIIKKRWIIYELKTYCPG